MADDRSEPERAGDAELLARLRPVVIATVVLGVGVCAAVVLSSELAAPDAATWAWAAGVWVLAVVAGLVNFPVFVGRIHESTALGELGLIPAMLLFDPPLAVAIAVSSLLVVEVALTRGVDSRVMKVAFNTSFQAAGVAVGSWIHATVIGPGFPVTAASLAVAVLAALVAVAVNVVALASLQAAAGMDTWGTSVRDITASVAFVNLTTAATGILVAVLVTEAPLALPLLLVPLLLYRGRTRARSEGLERVRLERDRFERTVAGASHGVVLVDGRGSVEVWNPMIERMSGVPAADAIGRSLAELGMASVEGDTTGTGVTTSRTAIGELDVEVRRSSLEGGRGAVLSIQDVSREVELARIHEDLVSRISHELRTPLTTVEGFLETLQGRWDGFEVEERRRLVEAAQRGARRLSDLVDRLLLWSRIETRAARLSERGSAAGRQEQTHTDLADYVHQHLVAEDDVAVRAPEPGAGATTVALAPRDIDLILFNLLDNARVYGQPPIEVQVSANGTMVFLEVTDHGLGLPEGADFELFQPFRQGVEGLQRTGRGLGLGLAIVHRLVVAVGGEVDVVEPDHTGLRVVVALPAVGVAPGAPTGRVPGRDDD